MSCRECPNATAIYIHGGMYFECSASLPQTAHLPGLTSNPVRVMVNLDKVFVPWSCPRQDIPVCDKTPRENSRKKQQVVIIRPAAFPRNCEPNPCIDAKDTRRK